MTVARAVQARGTSIVTVRLLRRMFYPFFKQARCGMVFKTPALFKQAIIF